MKCILYSLPFILAATVALAASPAPVLTLGDAQRMALENHPQVKEGGYDVLEARQDVTITRSSYLPQVSGNAVRAFAGDNTRIAATTGLNNPTVFDRASAGVGVTQLVTDFGRTQKLLQSAEDELKSRQSAEAETRDEVLANVTVAYYEVLKSQSLLRVAEDTVKARNTLLKQVSALRDAKMKSDLDVSLAKLDVGQANLLLLKSRNGVQDAYSSLAETLGLPQSKTYRLRDEARLAPPPGDLPALEEQAAEGNPALAALKFRRESAQQFAEAQKRAGLPTVSALGYVGATPEDRDNRLSDHYAAAGLNISMPIFTGGRITAEANKAVYQQRVAQEQLDELNNQLMRDVQLAFHQSQTAYRNISVTAQNLKSANEALTLTKTRYDIGQSSIVDLQQAQLAKTEADISNANAKYDYLVERALLKLKVGDTSAQTVAVETLRAGAKQP